GFAHFIAAAAQNKRSANNGVFVVSSKRYTLDSQGNTIKIPSNTAMDLNPDANGDLPQFTDKFCQPPSKYPYLGSELDWLIFLWGLWTGAPEVRFDVAEINEVWAKTKPTISLEFYSLLHTSFEAHCVPATTRKNDIISFDPASGYEKRWTCKDKPWTFNSFKVYTSTSVVDGKGRSIIVPYEKINSVASAYELWSGVYTRHNYQTQNAVIQL
ncbi:MAG: hypothetical protein JXR76_12985, partial [Deltaproteobacteria bacterium]|nr:hypothetical protein [Deltaproteobacteria bacterium]